MPVQNFVADLVRKEGGGAVYCAAVFDNHDIGDHCEHDDSDENEENRDDFFCRILPGTSIALIFAALATKTNRCPKANCSLMMRMIMMSNLMMVMMI